MIQFKISLRVHLINARLTETNQPVNHLHTVCFGTTQVLLSSDPVEQKPSLPACLCATVGPLVRMDYLQYI